MELKIDRYRKLRLEESLLNTCHYPCACKELALLIKLSFPKFPKNLQSLVFQDVLSAFRLLPRMQTQCAVSAANTLLQSVESALPKQKKALAVTEFKHAMVAHKRFSKARNKDEEDLVELPQDVLVHVFSFLDLQSFVFASQVCGSWNAASRDNRLWQSLYTIYFSTYNLSEITKLIGGLTVDKKLEQSQESIFCGDNLEWRNLFKETYNGLSSKKLLTCSRGFCKHCHEIIWFSDLRNETISRVKCKYHQIRPLSTRQG
uniref:F-box protein At5g52880 isoform X2 n=1 Tax=Erigeron canadensis TaxID=72917 RepID=UPI001CB89414|nr:F-box protein At5g52880 isoform X2 [Erigeron canadensis]